MAFLLDTNSWILYLKSAVSPIRVRLEMLKPIDIVLCSVVKAELFEVLKNMEIASDALGSWRRCLLRTIQSRSTTERLQAMVEFGTNWNSRAI